MKGIFKKLVVSLFLATAEVANAGKVEQKEGSDMPVMVLMKRKMPHQQEVMNAEATGPKFMMLANNPQFNLDQALDAMAPVSAMSLPPPAFMGLGGAVPMQNEFLKQAILSGSIPSPSGGMPSPGDFMSMAIQSQLVRELKTVQSQMTAQMEKMNQIEAKVDKLAGKDTEGSAKTNSRIQLVQDGSNATQSSNTTAPPNSGQANATEQGGKNQTADGKQDKKNQNGKQKKNKRVKNEMDQKKQQDKQEQDKKSAEEAKKKQEQEQKEAEKQMIDYQKMEEIVKQSKQEKGKTAKGNDQGQPQAPNAANTTKSFQVHPTSGSIELHQVSKEKI